MRPSYTVSISCPPGDLLLGTGATRVPAAGRRAAAFRAEGACMQQAMTTGFDAVDLLAALVSARSPNPPGDERAVSGVIRDALRLLGLPEPTVIARSAERPNMLVRIDGAGPRLMLVGHMDTMPPGDLGSWNSDPFELERSEGRLTGLGVADMKSGIAAALLAAARLVRDPAWNGSLDLLFTADEENCSDYGMKWLAGQDMLAADAAVILEPAGGPDA